MESSRPGSARAFFDKWFVAVNGENRLPRVHDKKLSILAMCALLELPPASVPDTLRDGWHGIVGGVLTIFKDLPKAIERSCCLGFVYLFTYVFFFLSNRS